MHQTRASHVYIQKTSLSAAIQIIQKIGKAWVDPFLICLAKEMQHVTFFAHVHVRSPSNILTRIIVKDIAVDSETVCLWLVDHSFDCATKDSVLYYALLRF